MCIIETLSSLKDRQAVEALIKSLDDKIPEIKIAAARSLGVQGDERAEEALIMKLNKKPFRVSEASNTGSWKNRRQKNS